VSTEVVRGSTNMSAAMDQLVDAVLNEVSAGNLWVGFPLLNDLDSTYAVDALNLSPLDTGSGFTGLP
jgi:hypothetical protein